MQSVLRGHSWLHAANGAWKTHALHGTTLIPLQHRHLRPPNAPLMCCARRAALHAQGKQLDVTIVSLVRCGRGLRASKSSLGFVADMRRMNVAITRAKRALWLLCHFESLQASATCLHACMQACKQASSACMQGGAGWWGGV